jgi:tetratricopeptide (TPR) repeat protein
MDLREDKANEAEERGDLNSALQLWRELAGERDDPLLLSRYGRVAQKMERWDEAESAFAKALRLDSNFLVAMEAMGDLWATRTDRSDTESFGVAKDWFLKALRRERNSRTLTLLGATYRALGESVAARDAFAEAVELNPNYEEALYNLALAEKEGDPQGAVGLLERAIDIDPCYFVAHQELGKLYQKMGDLQRAEYHFRRSLEISQNEFWSLLYLANALAVQGKDVEAEKKYRLATTLHPERKDGAKFFARFLESIGKKPAAITTPSPEKSPDGES